jgi:hypothetical protein
MPLITTLSLGADNLPQKYTLGDLIIEDTKINLEVDDREISVTLRCN